MDLIEIESEDVDWIYFDQNRIQLPAVVDTVMNILVPKHMVKYLINWVLFIIVISKVLFN
jgi:hypothetical protein